MMLAAIAALAFAPQIDAADFFPLQAGMKWVYEVTGASSSTFTQEVAMPVEFPTQSLSPINVVVRGKVVQTVYYDVTPSGVSVLGLDSQKFFDEPQPVFKVGEKPMKWEYSGRSPYEDDKESSMKLKGESRLIGSREILGTKRECLEVKTETLIGLNDKTATLFKRTSIYAKGLGLVETQESSKAGKQESKSTIKLIKFESVGASNW